MSEGSKGALGSKAALIEFVKKNQECTLRQAKDLIDCYTTYFYATQSFGGAPSQETLEEMGSGSLNDTNFWVRREQMRFANVLDVAYEQPSSKLQSVMAHRPDLRFHFLHMSVEEPGMVAYTPSIAYGIQDRQVRAKLGKYLTQFYGEHLTALQIKRLVDGSADINPVILDSDQIVHVYINGPGSCMGGSDHDSELDGIHPCAAYETEDWKIAVLKDGDAITDRALICVHGVKEGDDVKGYFVRCYGDNADALKEKLIAMGYSFELRWPRGAKLKLIECSGGIVAPYLDGGRREVGRNGDHLEIGGGDYTFDNSCGYIDEHPQVECDNCGDDSDPDEMTETYDGSNVCRNCIENYFVVAYVSRGSRQEYAHIDNVVCCQSDGEYYLDDSSVLHAHGIYQCEVRGEYYHVDDMVETDDGWVHKEDYTPPKDKDTLELPLEENEERRAA